MRWSSAALVAAVMAAAGGCAHTAGDTRDDEKAVKLFEEGLEQLGQRRYAKALASFEKVRELRWTPVVDYQIGRSLDGLGRTAAACRTWGLLEHDGGLRRLVSDGISGAEEMAAAAKKAYDACWTEGMGLLPPARGAADALVTVVMFGGFQCAYTAKMVPRLDALTKRFPGKIRTVFLHLPFSFHPEGMASARASVAAQLQGRFWEMHDTMFAHRADLGDAAYVQWAREVGLDVERFKKDMADPAVEKWILRNGGLAAGIGVKATPWIFVNGRGFRGAQTVTTLERAVKSTLADAEKLLEKGLTPAEIHAELTKKQNPAYHALIVEGGYYAALPSERETAEKFVKALPKEVWKVPVDPASPALGQPDALVTVVQFGDFQCQYCRRVHPILKKVLAEQGPANVRLVWRNFPHAFHGRSRPAAHAALAAHLQGRFWAMHDALYGSTDLSDGEIGKAAMAAGLDMARFRADLTAHAAEFDQRIQEDVRVSREVKNASTPCFFVNGRRLVGSKSAEVFKLVIAEALEDAKKRVAAGVARAKLYETIVAGGTLVLPLDGTVHRFTDAGRRTLGPATAPATVTLFNDVTCWSCASAEMLAKQLVQKLPGKVRVVLKSLPQGYMKQATQNALAVLAAARQGKADEMTQLLIRNRGTLKPDSYAAFAKTLGLKAKRFAKDMAAPALAALVAEDIKEGRAAGASGAPVFFVNGRRYQNWPRDLPSLIAVIQGYALKP